MFYIGCGCDPELIKVEDLTKQNTINAESRRTWPFVSVGFFYFEFIVFTLTWPPHPGSTLGRKDQVLMLYTSKLPK